ncbi:hypothetical protein BSKO_07927 [Bryopsis sp. KO-2023]|nr:hypothetical protein BSKO_07927 [Bryopsis sp. KO-2023]
MKKFDTWLLVVRFINRLKRSSKKDYMYRKLSELNIDDSDHSERQDKQLLRQCHSSTDPTHQHCDGAGVEVDIKHNETNQKSMEEVEAVDPPHAPDQNEGPSKKKHSVAFESDILGELPNKSYGSGTFLKVPTPSDAATQYSSDSIHSSLEDELHKLEHMLQPDGPFRTAAVLRDAVVGLGSLSRKLDQLLEEDPTVEECPADVEMLVRRAGELFTALQDFASKKGIPVASGSFKKRSRSNPELFFEDNAPWLSEDVEEEEKSNGTPKAWAQSEAGAFSFARKRTSQSFSDASQGSRFSG